MQAIPPRRFSARIRPPVLGLVALSLVLGMAAARGQESVVAIEGLGVWTPVYRGVASASLSADRPRPMKGHALRVDLREPTVDFLATPSNEERPKDTDGLRTTTFLERYGCEAAINGAPFDVIHEEDGLPTDVVGLVVSDGEIVSPAHGRYPALLIGPERAVRIQDPPFDTNDVRQAVGGFGIVLDDGEVVGANDALHPRTAAGVSRDGRYLYLLVVDGRQPLYSEGATTAEVGAWLKRLGAWDGINLDGGGTTTMVLRDEAGAPRILNRPIHGGIPGRERVSGSHLGIQAEPLP
jgi:hypothetical protein